MAENELILAELRKISAWLDFQRKLAKWSLLLLGALIIAGIAGSVVADREINRNMTPEIRPDWYQVDQDVRTGDFDAAIRVGEELTKNTPQYPDAHHRLAGVYLAAGKVEKAREEYAEAFRLLPSEENGKLLAAVDQRIKAESPKP